MEGYSVKSIDTFECKEWILKKHYAKRMPPIEFSFGLFNEINILQGIVTFGTPVSSTLRDLWNGDFKLLELNRLVVNEGLPKNCLSFFVSQSLLMIPKPKVIVSYADTSQNHNGYIYQATNFYYTGLSIPFKEWKIKGLEHMHHATIHDLSRGQENRLEWLKDKFGDNLIEVERPQKHRYFIFLGSKTDKKIMKTKCPYKFLPYPKGENKRYDASHTPLIQTKLF
jgi:hypothetical protein